MALCKDIYPELHEYLILLKGTETEFDETTGVTRYVLRGKPYVLLLADGTVDAALMIASQPGRHDTSVLMHPDVSERTDGGKCFVCVKLTGTVPYELVRDMCGIGYNLVLRHFSRKVQHEILEDTWA